jgi:hypothetical protein
MKHEVAQSICAARVVLQSLRVLTMMLASALGDAEEPGRGRKAKLAHGRAEAPAEADALDRRRQARQATERTAAAREAGMGVAPVLAPNWVLAPSPIWGARAMAGTGENPADRFLHRVDLPMWASHRRRDNNRRAGRRGYLWNAPNHLGRC